MQNQRAYKLGRSFAQATDASDLIMRRSLRGLDMSEGKARARLTDATNNTRHHKSMVGSRISQLNSTSRRLKTEFSRVKQDPKAPSLEETPTADPKQSDKLNRFFVVRPHNSFVLQRNANPLKKRIQLPPISNSKTSTKCYGPIKAYSANTHCGLYRSYNEDRIAISLNLTKEKSIHCFGVFDGHGGVACAEFLSSNLFDAIVSCEKDVRDLARSIPTSFQEIQNKFLELAKANDPVEKSGSCALMALVADDTVYVSNVGDSRAILISHNQVSQLTVDHKPSSPSQRDRIQNHGGKLYQTKFSLPNSSDSELGPCRVWPGRLSVSRTIGDIQAKDPSFGGIKNVISPQPEMHTFKIVSGTTLVLACDGVFDRISNEDVAEMYRMDAEAKNQNLAEVTGKATENLLREAMFRNSYDNLSVISISF